MIITCNRQDLAEAVVNVQRSVSSRSTMPALEGILIETENDKVKLCGYNLELGIITHINAKIEAEGSIILNAKLFSDIVRLLPDGTVKISTDNKLNTEIQNGKSEFSIIGIDANEYPELPNIQGSSEFTISSLLIKSMIKQTLFAIAENDSKPIHTGALFDIKEKHIKLVSVDGYRLAMRKEELNFNENLSFVVPKKTLMEVIKLIPDTVSNIKIIVGNRHIIFEIENYCVISRLLDGEFLDYNAAIPSQFTTQFKTNTRQFIDSVERVSLLITDRLKSPIRCIFSDDQVKLSCSTSIGKANDEFKAQIEGNKTEIGFNNRYLLDALKNAETDEVLIQLNGPLSPMKVLPSDGDSFLFLVLPVRLKAE